MIPFRRLPQILSGLLGAGLFSQFPAFYDQYVQSLGGRLDQARLHAARIAAAAREQGLSVDAYLRHFAENSDTAVRPQAEVMAAALADTERLGTALQVLTHAHLGARPLALLRHMDPDVAAATAERFAPAAPLGLEGVIYAGLGALLALALFQGGRSLARRLGQREGWRRGRRNGPVPGRSETRGSNHAG